MDLTDGRSPRSFLRSRLFPVAVALNVLVTPVWFVLHRSTASAEWVSGLVRHDQADYYQTHPADLHLAFLFGSNGLTEQRDEALASGRKAHPDDPRFPLGLARIAASEGNWQEAETLAMEAYGIVRGYLPALDVLYDVFRATGRAEDQLGVGDLILGAAASDPTGVSPFLSSARLDEIRRGVEEIRRSTAGGPRRELEVESELERALEREPERGLEGESEREPGREPEGESEREPGREPEREPEGESEREPEREPEGESEREPEREPEGESEREPEREPQQVP